jgi:membrane protease YdiL (CAAX protease family)
VRRPDVFVAKALLVVGAALAGTLWYFRTDPTVEGEVPFLAMFAGAVLVAMGFAGLYEAASYSLAWLISRVRQSVAGATRAEAIAPTEESAGAEDDGVLPGGVGAKEAGMTFLAYLAGSAVVWIVLGLWVSLSGPEALPAEDLERAFLELAPRWFVVASVLGAVAAIWAFQRLSPTPVRALPGVVGLGRGRTIALGVLVGAAVNLAYLQMVPFLPVQPTRMPDSALWDLLLSPGASRWLVLLTAVTVAPLTEELVFRGLIFEGLGRSWSTGAAVVGAAVLFTLLHVPDTAHYWPAAVMIFVMGSVAGVFRARTGHIGPAVGVHFGHNAVVAALWLL